MNIFLVRHGETEWNSLGRFQGQVDVTLNSRGVGQSLDIAKASFTWGLNAIYTSPLIRTMQVAEEIGKQIGLPVITDDRLMELSLGELEGITGQDMRSKTASHFTGRGKPAMGAYSPALLQGSLRQQRRRGETCRPRSRMDRTRSRSLRNGRAVACPLLSERKAPRPETPGHPGPR